MQDLNPRVRLAEKAPWGQQEAVCREPLCCLQTEQRARCGGKPVRARYAQAGFTPTRTSSAAAYADAILRPSGQASELGLEEPAYCVFSSRTATSPASSPVNEPGSLMPTGGPSAARPGAPCSEWARSSGACFVTEPVVPPARRRKKSRRPMSLMLPRFRGTSGDPWTAVKDVRSEPREARPAVFVRCHELAVEDEPARKLCELESSQSQRCARGDDLAVALERKDSADEPT
jgi:hypothetical protein